MQKTKSSRQANLVVSPSCSDLPFTGVRGRVLAQILAQDLADVRLRQIVAELDQSRHFVAGEFASAEIAHRLGVKRRIGAHDICLDGFPVAASGTPITAQSFTPASP